LIRCPTCDIAYASPVPAQEAIHDAYESAPFISGVESRFAAVTYGELVTKFVIPKLGKATAALDIGASDGAFMQVLNRIGFDDVHGIEPSTPSVESADAEIRHRIVNGPFTDSSFEDRRFDLVTILQTLEHLSDPLQVVRDAGALLRDEGALLIVVHDRLALQARLMGFRSPIYDVEHLQLFSKRGIRALLATAGFGNVEVHSIRNRYPLSYWLKISPLPDRARRTIARLLESTSAGRLPLTIAPGNIAAIGWMDR
jgi:SAM-dependent methyltransferase